MNKCEMCFEDVIYPFTCKYCGGKFCPEHRLPEKHLCPRTPPRTPLGYYKAKKTSKTSSSPITHLKGRRQLKLKDFKNTITSLKLWFPIFLLVTLLLFFLEKDNPTQFYRSVPELMKYGLYVFASIIGLGSGYRIFQKCDYNPSSDRGVFGLRLLSGGIMIAAVFTLLISFTLMSQNLFIFGGLFMQPQISLVREITALFFIVLSLVLIVLSGYLVFKFQRRSGVIVYRR